MSNYEYLRRGQACLSLSLSFYLLSGKKFGPAWPGLHLAKIVFGLRHQGLVEARTSSSPLMDWKQCTTCIGTLGGGRFGGRWLLLGQPLFLLREAHKFCLAAEQYSTHSYDSTLSTVHLTTCSRILWASQEEVKREKEKYALGKYTRGKYTTL